MPSPFAAVAKTLQSPLQDQKENIAKFLAPRSLQVSPFAAVAKTLPEPLQHALLAETIAKFLQYFKGMPASNYTHFQLYHMCVYLVPAPVMVEVNPLVRRRLLWYEKVIEEDEMNPWEADKTICLRLLEEHWEGNDAPWANRSYIRKVSLGDGRFIRKVSLGAGRFHSAFGLRGGVNDGMRNAMARAKDLFKHALGNGEGKLVDHRSMCSACDDDFCDTGKCKECFLRRAISQ